MDSRKPVVAAVRAQDLDRDLDRCLNLLGGVRRFARPGDRVLIKPNFGVPRPASSAVVTDPDLVFALAERFLQVGANVMLGESCVTGFDLARVWETLGVPERAARLGIDLVDLRLGKYAVVKIDAGMVLDQVKVSAHALEADLIVNVPKMKTHVETTVTLALKNLKGVLSGNEKARFHQLDVPIEAALEAAIVDLNSVLPPTLDVVDGIIAMEGGGPLEGTPVPFGVLVAGDNRVAVDSTCCYLMGIEPAEVRHIAWAAERGLGPMDPSEFCLLGDALESLRYPFRRPEEMEFSVPAIILEEAGACSGCAGGIRQALRGMRDHPAAQNEEACLRVFVGAKVEGPSDPTDLLMGNCAIRRLRTGVMVPGCPPLFGKMRVAMLRALAGDEDAESVQDGDRRL